MTLTPQVKESTLRLCGLIFMSWNSLRSMLTIKDVRRTANVVNFFLFFFILHTSWFLYAVSVHLEVLIESWHFFLPQDQSFVSASIPQMWAASIPLSSLRSSVTLMGLWWPECPRRSWVPGFVANVSFSMEKASCSIRFPFSNVFFKPLSTKGSSFASSLHSNLFIVCCANAWIFHSELTPDLWDLDLEQWFSTGNSFAPAKEIFDIFSCLNWGGWEGVVLLASNGGWRPEMLLNLTVHRRAESYLPQNANQAAVEKLLSRV